MEIKVELIPVFETNYIFLLTTTESKQAVIVDPGESAACIQELNDRKLDLIAILITHHHADHIDGIEGLKNAFPRAKVFAPFKNKDHIPAVDFYLKDSQALNLDNFGKFKVLELPGHTLGHIGYYHEQQNLLFSGDVLFGLGCGRLFEGTPQVKYQTLQILKQLPPQTQIFCAHEYTETNANFVEELVRQKKIPQSFDAGLFAGYKEELLLKRKKRLPTVPLNLNHELNFNPFLLSRTVDEFTELRALRNNF